MCGSRTEESVNVVILAGGYGSRLSEETNLKPKPMVEIGGRPILWHILKLFDSFGFQHFFVALGYKGEFIKRYFLDYYKLNLAQAINISTGRITHRRNNTDEWTIHLIDTGLDTMTGGRIKRLESWLNRETFIVTYGDGVSDIDMHALIAFHQSHGRIATITAVQPPARYGGLQFEGDFIRTFVEKPETGEGWINGGFMVFEPAIFEWLDGDPCILERDGLERLATANQLAAYKHTGFWQCMDTLQEKQILEKLWEERRAPWKRWQDDNSYS